MRGLRLALLIALVLAWLPLAAATASAQPANVATLDPARGPVGTRVTIGGAGWPAGRGVTVTFGKSDYFEWVKGVVAPDGTLALTATVPRQYASVAGANVMVTAGDYTVTVVTAPGPDRSTLAATVKFTVVEPAPGPPAISWRFADYYYQHDGGRLLGNPLSEVRLENGRRVQYFEKGRIEDHIGEPGADGPWRFLFGRLGADLTAGGSALPVGGDASSVTYATLKELAQADRRLPAPPGWSGIVAPGPEEAAFVPFDSALKPAPGHYVPARFWGYINQPALFPAGWVHDIGLPLTEAVPATVTKTVRGERVERPIRLQLFERTVLTDDPANPEGFQIERANIGGDYLKVAQGRAIPGDVVLHPAFQWLDPLTTDEDLPAGMVAPAWQWRSRFNPTVHMEDEIGPVQQRLEQEGWRVTARTGGVTSGAIEAVKGQRLQVIRWWQGTQPAASPPVQPELGTQMRVLIGMRS